MSDSVEGKDVNMDGIDNVMDDHDAGVGSSANEMETHNLDIDDYDEVIDNAMKSEGDDTLGEAETTDDSPEVEAKSSDKDEEMVPKSTFKERLDEVIGQRDEYKSSFEEERLERARIEGRLRALEERLESSSKTPEPQAAPNPFEELLQGDAQEILDAMTEDPAGFFRNMQEISNRQAREQLRAEEEEKSYYDNLRSGLDKFAADHDGFIENIEKMHGVVNENPIHNLVSAYAYEVEIPKLQSEIESVRNEYEEKLKAAKAEGIKVGKAEALKEVKAKGGAAVLDGSSSSQGGRVSGDPELEDTNKSGGLLKTLTDQLKRRREQAGG